MTFSVLHKSGQWLAQNINEGTVRKVLRNVGPVACDVLSEADCVDGLNGVEWLIDNPGERFAENVPTHAPGANE